jgi:hypothetical protein
VYKISLYQTCCAFSQIREPSQFFVYRRERNGRDGGRHPGSGNDPLARSDEGRNRDRGSDESVGLVADPAQHHQVQGRIGAD